VAVLERHPGHALAGSRVGGVHRRAIENSIAGVAVRFLAEGLPAGYSG
jgi:hypothetical protein